MREGTKEACPSLVFHSYPSFSILNTYRVFYLCYLTTFVYIHNDNTKYLSNRVTSNKMT
jgi:hypothetical protein